ncbi:glycosyltransferase family protein [Candidatus Chloroploca sp. Khr17]|uniref:glycosyltransferase family protein n=1 Tax=Candidatus Chloroploca sp. Khr17 TaxID=2496869 RepID=UPI00101C9EA3|nr:glycosyltransferase [Candidatus Chloroploca sp. Khr17]
MRRNLLLARALLRLTPCPNILLIGGAREMGAFAIPEGIDCLTLPALHKEADGLYRPRSLSISLRRMLEMRASSIKAAVASYDPDLLLTDKVPLGAFGELRPTLDWLRARKKARCVLGLREILDEPAVARREWAAEGNNAAVETYYDQVWIYGDRRIADPVREYGFSAAVAARLIYAGYLNRAAFLDDDPQAEAALCAKIDLPEDARMALCCVGGGQDGFALARSFARAALPEGMVGVILTGPLMAASEQAVLQRMVAERPWLRLVTFLEEPTPLMRRADAVIAMAGYNTVCEILTLARRALLVPRVVPRREQLIRAQRLRDLGLVDMLHPRRVSPASLTSWLARTPDPALQPRLQLDMGALDHVAELVQALVFHQIDIKESPCAD